MSYEQKLEDLLAEIDTYESLKDLQSSVSPRDAINKILKRLSIGDWKIFINKIFGWCVATSDKYKIGDCGTLELTSFESFRDTLLEAISYYTRTMETRKYSSIKDYIEKGVSIALEIEKRVDESLYEDIIFELRRYKDSKSLRASSRSLTAKLEKRYADLCDRVREVAKTWVSEKLDAGMELMIYPNRNPRKVKKVVRSGTVLISTEDGKLIYADSKDLDVVRTWQLNTEEAGEILKRVGYSNE